MWGTFLALLFRPGQLTVDYWAGRRGLWMRPLRIFLIVSALSLILTPQAAGPLGMKILAREGAKGTELTIGARATPFKMQQGVQISKGFETRDGAMTIQLDRTLTPEKIVELNEKIHKFYKVIQYLGLAICAAVSLLLGRKIQPFYGAHLIFALHYYSFIYILTGIATFLPIHPGIATTTRLAYLTIAIWRLIGSGRNSTRKYGVDWSSLWRAVVLFTSISASELAGLGLSSALALKFIK
ncbi:MAG: DUF3667 domain-containing protein [Acidobacteria bacterium]|nr:DUF3667 domain-containing protein [Acidobacteriota bacterium]